MTIPVLCAHCRRPVRGRSPAGPPPDGTERLRELLREALDGWEMAQAGLHQEFCTSSDHRGRACEPRIEEIRQEVSPTDLR